jgi:hypothetical protein
VGFDEAEVFKDDSHHLTADAGVVLEKVHSLKLGSPTDTKRPPRRTAAAKCEGDD